MRIIHPSSCSRDHYLVAYGARLMDHLARQQPLRAPGPMTRLLRSLRPVTFANFNSAQNAELVPPTLVLKKSQERSIRRNCVQDRLSRHAFYT